LTGPCTPFPVIKYTTPWGRNHYEVLGSTATYTVIPQLLAAKAGARAYCSCPAFTYAVLISETYVMVRTSQYFTTM
ncbi:hypothetical protein HWV62_36795, partial [Athelia sp. TMB]